MISLKKLITVTAVAVLSLNLFAQTSKTNTATAGLFGNDVDDYMSVNYWSGIAPEKFFGYFGMGTNRAGNTYNLGFAKQFKNFYWGTYYSGNLGSLKTTKTTTPSTTTVTTESDTYNKVTDLAFNNVFGFGNIGLGVDFSYYDNGTSTKTKSTKTTLTDAKNWSIALNAGLSEYTFKNVKLIPFAKVAFEMNPNVTGSKVIALDFEGNEQTTDTRFKVFSIAAGAEMPFGKSETVEQTASFALEFDFTSPVDSDIKDNNSTAIVIPLGYKVVVKASDALSLGFKANLDSTLGFGKRGENVSTFGFELSPDVSAGVTYATKKNVDLNAGVSFALPSYTYSKTTTKADSGNTSTSTSTWDGDDGKLTFSSGFAIKPTKNICIDCSYEIIRDLFVDDTSTNFSTGNATNFWNSVNQVLVHNIGFEVSVKF